MGDIPKKYKAVIYDKPGEVLADGSMQRLLAIADIL